MLITEITDEKKVNTKNNTSDTYANTSDEDDLVRLSAYRLHQLTNRLINSQEDERNRISRELHDGLGQILSALKYQVESAVIESEKSTQLIENNENLRESHYEYLTLGKGSFLGDGSPLKELNRT